VWPDGLLWVVYSVSIDIIIEMQYCVLFDVCIMCVYILLLLFVTSILLLFLLLCLVFQYCWYVCLYICSVCCIVVYALFSTLLLLLLYWLLWYFVDVHCYDGNSLLLLIRLWWYLFSIMLFLLCDIHCGGIYCCAFDIVIIIVINIDKVLLLYICYCVIVTIDICYCWYSVFVIIILIVLLLLFICMMMIMYYSFLVLLSVCYLFSIVDTCIVILVDIVISFPLYFQYCIIVYSDIHWCSGIRYSMLLLLFDFSCWLLLLMWLLMVLIFYITWYSYSNDVIHGVCCDIVAVDIVVDDLCVFICFRHCWCHSNYCYLWYSICCIDAVIFTLWYVVIIHCIVNICIWYDTGILVVLWYIVVFDRYWLYYDMTSLILFFYCWILMWYDLYSYTVLLYCVSIIIIDVVDIIYMW